MAREVKINTSVEHNGAVSSINEIKKAFQGLNRYIKRTGGADGEFKLKLNISGEDVKTIRLLAENFGLITQEMKKYNMTVKEVAKNGKHLNKATSDIRKSINATTLALKNYNYAMSQTSKSQKSVESSTIATLTVFDLTKRYISGAIKSYNELTDATFGVGIAGQMNLKQISALNESFISLSTVVPRSATELAKAVDDLIRTGRSYEDARKIIEETAKLSVASGDDLKSTASVVTKVMVALGIKGDYVSSTLNTLHSVAIQTASDMKYLGGAFKTVAGTASIFVHSSGLAGEELEKYKQKVFDTNLALIGSLANLGLSSSEAGTKIKVITSRLLSAEKSAKLLFNTAMKLNNFKINGKLFDYEGLSDLAKKDLQGALQLLSELTKKGIVSDQVLSKLFTNRHFGEAKFLLTSINGNMEAFVDNIAKGVNYTDDMLKNMFNINEQVKQFANNISATTSGSLGLVKDSMTGLLMLFNDSFKQMSINAKNSSQSVQVMRTAFNGFVASVTTAGIALSSVFAIGKLLMPLFTGLGAVLGTYLLPLTAVVGLLGLIAKNSYDTKKAYVDINLALSKFPNILNKAINEADILNNRIQQVKDTLDDANDIQLNAELNNASVVMDALISKSKELKDYLTASQNWKLLDFSDSLNGLKILQEKTNTIKKALEGLKTEKLNIENKMIDKAVVKRKRGMFNRYISLDHMPNYQEKILKEFMKLRSQKPSDELLKKLNESGESYAEYILNTLVDKFETKNVKKDAIARLIGRMDTKPLDEAEGKIENMREKLQNLSAELKKYSDDAEKQALDNLEAYNKQTALLTETQLKELATTGKTIIDDVVVEGFEGLAKVSEKSFLGMYENQIKAKENAVKDLNTIIDTLKAKYIESNAEMSEEDKKTMEESKRKVEVFNKEIAELLGTLDLVKRETIITQSELSDLFSGIKFDPKQTESYVLLLSMLRDRKLATLDGNKVREANDNRILESTKNTLKYQQNRQSEKEIESTKYQLKHISYLKESLQVNLELAKIGATQQEQAYLEYYYKVKTTQENEKLAKINKQNVEDMLKSYKAQSKVGKDYIEKALKMDNPEALAELLNKFEKQYSGIMTGKQGKSIKSDYDEIAKFYEAILKLKEASTSYLVELKKGFQSLADYNTSEVFKVLSENSPQYTRQYTDTLLGEFLNQKDKVAKEMNLPFSFDLDDTIKATVDKVDFLKDLLATPKSLEMNKDKFLAMFGQDAYNKFQESEENRALLMSKEQHRLMGLVELEELRVKYNNEVEKSLLKQLDGMGKLSTFLSKSGDIFGVELFGKLGNVVDGIKDFQSFAKSPTNDFQFSKLFDVKDIFEKGMDSVNWDKYFDNFGKVFESMTKSMAQGSAIGNLVGSITGGGRSSQQAGALAGMVTGAISGLNPFAGIGIQVGASLLGGLFDKGEKDQEEADRKTKEANKIYNKNTEALQKLSQNMASLNGGVDGLNNSLISSFSKIPTVGNLNRVTDAMKQLYTTMDKTRIFNEVAYQVTKHKKGKKGFLGIGATAGTSWTETIKLSVQEMLNRYGFKGTIYDMSTQQIRDFSKWLKDYDLGDSDNFSVLAEALENYAEALDKFDKNIDKFFRDTTMEAFEGISSIQQEELRQQIEDFYKNLGLQIDEETSKEIDKIAEQMSVMVTIMQDVRKNFVDIWKDSGLDAGKAFLSSMTPYVDALLNNISQIYYDVYFSDINKQLEDEFKNLSEKLVELKKQGGQLNWKDVGDSLSGSFDKVLNVINSAKGETESFNGILLDLQKQALESGLKLSEIFQLGLTTGTQKDVIESFKDALSSNETEGAFVSFGQMVGNKVGEALVNKVIDNMLGEKILQMSAQLDKVLSGNLSFDSLASLSQEAMGVGSMLEAERLRFEAIKDMFDWNKDINYQNQNSEIKYETGTSQSVVNNYYLTATVEAGNVIESESVQRLADSLLDVIVDKFKNERGYSIV